MNKISEKSKLNARRCCRRLIAFLFLAFFINQTAIAEQAAEEASSQSSLLAFRENGVVVEMGRTIPTFKARREFSAGHKPGKRLVYRRVLEQDWMAAIGFGFKEWNLIEFETPMSIFTVDHEIHRLIRINHPLYLAIGMRTSFMVPALNNSIPPKRYPGFDAEVGTAASLQLIGRISSHSTWNVRFERWRGTKTSRLHGYELAIGIGMDFKSQRGESSR
jgi:hypothetical protein